MTNRSSEAYAVLLLACPVDPTVDGAANPLSVSEFYRIARAAEAQSIPLDQLERMDISGLRLAFGLDEEAASRVSLLLLRVVPMVMAQEKLEQAGILAICYNERAYPRRLLRLLPNLTPPVLFMAGRGECFRQPAIAILGMAPCDAATEALAACLTALATEAGYMVLTDGATGAGGVVGATIRRKGGHLIEVLADAMSDRVREPDMADMLECSMATCLSMVHPDAPQDRRHAQDRNKLVYALSQAVFVLSCDARKGAIFDGAMESLRLGTCGFVYARDDTPSGQQLIARGALPLPAQMAQPDFERMAALWRLRGAEQIRMFDEDE